MNQRFHNAFQPDQSAVPKGLRIILPIQTRRLIITRFEPSMAAGVARLSWDAENRRFVPDEVFESEKDASQCMAALIKAYDGEKGPFVFPVLKRENNALVGHVELSPLENDWEIGYHIGREYRGNGYAAEAARALSAAALDMLPAQRIIGVCLKDNIASARTMENAGYTLRREKQGLYQGKPAQIRIYEYKKPAQPDASRPDL